MKYPALWCAAAATLSLSPVALAASPDASGVAAPTPAEAPPEASTLPTLIGGDLVISDFEESIAAAMAQTQVPGASIAVVNAKGIVYEGVFGLEEWGTDQPITPSTQFEAASLSKPLFAFLAMTLVEEGKLDLDAPLKSYLDLAPLAGDERFSKLTARHVLSHQSGLPNWRKDLPDGKLALAFTPGEGFGYSGEGYEYLADVVMALSGVDDAGLERLYQNRIAAPLGMKASRFIASSADLNARAIPHKGEQKLRLKAPDPSFGAAYSLHSNAGDYARFVAGLLRREILKPETYALYFEPQNVPIPKDDPQRALGLSDWALGFSVYELPMGRVYLHGGNNPGYSNLVILSPDAEWGAVIFTNSDQANGFLLAAVQKISGLGG